MKKGISPLIATILIVGFTIALGAIFITWGTGFSKHLQKQTEEYALESITCSSDVMIFFKSSCLVGNDAVLLIENSGNKAFEGLLVRFYGSNGGDSVSLNESLEAFGIKKFDSFFDAEKVGELEKIEVFPVINLGGKTVFCSNNYDKTEVVEECSLICENAHPELCSGLDIVLGEGYRSMCCENFELCC